MAHNNQEVEIKIPVGKNVFEKAKKFLTKNARRIGSSKELDTYFNAPHKNFLQSNHPTEYLRTRSKENGGHLAYKVAHLNEKGEKISIEEYEVSVSDTTQMEKILSALDFKSFLTIDKKREIYTLSDEFEIDLDNVRDLGYFVEIEALKDFGGREKTLEKLADVAKKLGLDPRKKDNDGYVLLLMKKRGL